MELKSLSVGRKAIIFNITLNPLSTDESAAVEERKITAHEAPLPELTDAFGKLGAVFCEILELPSDYATGLTVNRIQVTRTKGGTRSVCFRATKQLDIRTDYLHTLTTPFVQIDKPAEGESGEIQVESKHVKAIVKALNECERYAEGERSQQLLSFDKDKEALNAQFQNKDQTELAGV